MLAQANEAVATSIALGNDLVVALQNQDVEALDLLEANQAKFINEFYRQVALRELNAALFEVHEAKYTWKIGEPCRIAPHIP